MKCQQEWMECIKKKTNTKFYFRICLFFVYNNIDKKILNIYNKFIKLYLRKDEKMNTKLKTIRNVLVFGII